MLVKFIGTLLRGGQNNGSPKDVCVVIPGTSKCVMFHGKRKLRILITNLKIGRLP